MFNFGRNISINNAIIKPCIMIVVAFFAINSAFEEDLMQRARQKFKPIPAQAPELKDNPINPQNVELGQNLFFDPRLSASWTISCNSCHSLGMGGRALRFND